MVVIGCDKAGLSMVKIIMDYLKARGIQCKHVAADEQSCAHYPVVALEAARAVQSGEANYGILVCGTGIGMSMAANKIHGIRAAVCSEHYSAKYTRLHNDANILCLGARTIGPELALELVDTFLSTEFEGGRHADRLKMISAAETN